ncbi:MAG TPA: DUF2905 domain-containing protein [Firmicutes bacterium]|nr:DUF2905 domain-containing protein [Bacillota bacterium]
MGLGGLLFILGALLTFGGRLFRFGRLPGDILVQRGNFTFYFPILTCLILSIILSLIMRVFRR